MVTRRTALGAGLALASTFCIADFRELTPLVQRRRTARSFDALLFDETIPLPRTLAAFVDSHRRTLPPGLAPASIGPIRLPEAATPGSQ